MEVSHCFSDGDQAPPRPEALEELTRQGRDVEGRTPPAEETAGAKAQGQMGARHVQGTAEAGVAGAQSTGQGLERPGLAGRGKAVEGLGFHHKSNEKPLLIFSTHVGEGNESGKGR